MTKGDIDLIDLCSGTGESNTLPDLNVESPWISVEKETDFGAGAALTAGKRYAIVCRMLTQSARTFGGVTVDRNTATAFIGYLGTNAHIVFGEELDIINQHPTFGDSWFQTKASGVVKDSQTGGNVADHWQFDNVTFPVGGGQYDTWLFQVFTASEDYTITSVVLRMAYWETRDGFPPGTFQISIQAIDERFGVDNLTVTDAVSIVRVNVPVSGCHMTVYGVGKITGIITALEAEIDADAIVLPPTLKGTVTDCVATCFQNVDIDALLKGDVMLLSAALSQSNTLAAALGITNLFLTGQLHGQSWLGGNLLVMGDIGPPDPEPTPPVLFVGEIIVQSTIVGALVVEWSLTGTIAAQSNISGSLTIGDEIRGTIAAQSSLSGTLSLTKALVGTIAAQSTLVAELWGLVGTIAAQSTLSGHLSEMQGVIAAQSNITGSLLLQDEMRGTIAGQSQLLSGVTGHFSVVYGLAGTISGQSTIGGDTGAPLTDYIPEFMISRGSIGPVFEHSTYLNRELVTTHILE